MGEYGWEGKSTTRKRRGSGSKQLRNRLAMDESGDGLRKIDGSWRLRCL